jgi:hypothetical protein
MMNVIGVWGKALHMPLPGYAARRVSGMQHDAARGLPAQQLLYTVLGVRSKVLHLPLPKRAAWRVITSSYGPCTSGLSGCHM